MGDGLRPPPAPPRGQGLDGAGRGVNRPHPDQLVTDLDDPGRQAGRVVHDERRSVGGDVCGEAGDHVAVGGEALQHREDLLHQSVEALGPAVDAGRVVDDRHLRLLAWWVCPCESSASLVEWVLARGARSLHRAFRVLLVVVATGRSETAYETATDVNDTPPLSMSGDSTT